MRKFAGLLAVVFMFVAAAVVVTAGDKGPEKMTIESVKEKKPPVEFNHKAHQDDLKIECKTCHHATEEGKTPKKCSECHKKEADGDTPEFKKAMHNSCRDCHKKEKAAGKNPPTKCKECHKE